MSLFDYTRSQATASRLIARFGASGAIRRQSSTGGNAWDPSSGTITTTDHAVKMAVLDYSQRDINGTTIQQTDKQVFVSVDGLSIVPTTSDSVVTPDGQVLSVVNVKPLKPAATVVMYEIQGRL